MGCPQPSDHRSMIEINPKHGREHGLTGGPGTSATLGRAGWPTGPSCRGAGEGADPSGRILSGRVGLGLLWLNLGRLISDGRRRSRGKLGQGLPGCQRWRRPTPRWSYARGEGAGTLGSLGRWEGLRWVWGDTMDLVVGTTPAQRHQRVSVCGRVARRRR
jgi:hypothetical protein